MGPRGERILPCKGQHHVLYVVVPQPLLIERNEMKLFSSLKKAIAGGKYYECLVQRFAIWLYNGIAWGALKAILA